MPGTWRALTHQSSTDVERMLLLTDGTIFCHLGNARWSIFHPDSEGNYLNGTWSSAENMHHARKWFAASVIADGRVLVALGMPESLPGIDGDLSIEIYDPSAPASRRWTLHAAHPGWNADESGQTHMCILNDGRQVLVGTDSPLSPVDFGFGRQSSLYDVAANTWRLVDAGHETGSDTHAWTLLPEGTVLATNGYSQDFKYNPPSLRWIPVGHGRYSGIYIPNETHGLLLPDGRVWVVNYRDGQTVFYHPGSSPADAGTWTAGPGFPMIGIDRWQPDATHFAACLLPSGKVLCTGYAHDYSPHFFEFDPYDGEGSIVEVSQPELRFDPGHSNGGAILLLLPTGEVLMSFLGQMFLYTPSIDTRAPQAAWRPHITSPADTLYLGNEYTANGTLFNGMSQAMAHNPWRCAGTATNYPIIRLANIATRTVQYLRTYRHSSMGVATGTAPQSTHFIVPGTFPEGDAELSLIANGIKSNRIRVNVRRPYRKIFEPHEWNQLIGNLADGPLFVLGPRGIHPVPPFGPGDGVFKKQFTEQTVKAYQHLVRGLLMLNASSALTPHQFTNATTQNSEEQKQAVRELSYSLAMLRELGNQLDKHLNKANNGMKLEKDQLQG